MGLVVPLTQIQIDAACRLHQRLDQWWVSDAALKRLRETLPGFDRESCLIKSVVINTLYGTQVLAIVRMARHVEAVLHKTDIRTAKIELVERLALLRSAPNNLHRRFVSFAAKFCHFFLNEERFPIYDEAAREVIKLHLGKKGCVSDPAHPYSAFCENLARLRTEASLDGPGRELDRYLWITGMYMKWLKLRRKQNPRMNAELQSIFNHPDREAAAELDVLLPVGLDRVYVRRKVTSLSKA
jgi:hypothetical protein